VNSDQRAYPEADDLSLIAICRTLWDYKFLLIATGIVGAAIAAIVAFTATPVFRAEVVVTEVRQDDGAATGSLANQLGGLASLAGATLGAGAGTNPQAQAVLRSRKLVESFITRHKLLEAMSEPGAPAPTLWIATRDMQNNVIAIRDEKRVSTTIVAVDWKDPQVAARWANDFVALANEVLRTRAMEESERSIAFLNAQIPKTNVVEVQRALYNLVERESKKLMLANTRAEYAFAVVDPAVAPEQRVWPRRSLVILVGGVLGGFLGVLAAFAHNAWRSQSGRSTEPDGARSFQSATS
jgi:uncharacterized protein involved in exopolysaccharide biosynthesis